MVPDEPAPFAHEVLVRGAVVEAYPRIMGWQRFHAFDATDASSECKPTQGPGSGFRVSPDARWASALDHSHVSEYSCEHHAHGLRHAVELSRCARCARRSGAPAAL